MKNLKGLLLPTLLIALWGVLAFSGRWSSYILPPPSQVLESAGELLASGVLWKNIWASLARVVGGFSLAFIFALPLAIWLGRNPKLTPWVGPTLEFFRHTPPLALIPIFILWLGIGEATKLAIIVMASFFPLFLNAENGVRRTDYKLVEVGKSLGFSNSKILKRIVLPAALPSILLGMRLGLGYSWRALIGAEMVAASSGLGYLILDAEQMSRPDVVIVGIFAIGILGTLMDGAFHWLYSRLIPWSKEERVDE